MWFYNQDGPKIKACKTGRPLYCVSAIINMNMSLTSHMTKTHIIEALLCNAPVEGIKYVTINERMKNGIYSLNKIMLLFQKGFYSWLVGLYAIQLH